MFNTTKKQVAGQNLSVALLFKDLQTAKEVSIVFKKIGIHPYFYHDLKSFWAGILESTPSFCMVDVSMMSEGRLILKNHPLIVNEELPISFYYTDNSAPLLFSTFDIFHLGLIKNSSSYSGQIKSVLKRFNKMNSMARNEYNLEVNNRKLNKKIERLIVGSEDIREKNTYHKFLDSHVEKLQSLKTSISFEEAVSLFIKDFDLINSFGILELSKNAQKLVASECFSLKYKKIPTLWLGKTCRNGIEASAQVLASQVIMELVDGPMISLNIEGIKSNPERYIFMQLDDIEFIEQFDWVGLERALSSLYAYFMNKDHSYNIESNHMKNSFELLSFLDAFKHGKYPDGRVPKGFSGEDYALLDINIENIVDLALSSSGKGRFYWQEFYKDYILKLESHLKGSFEAIPMGVNHIAILVEKSDGVDYFNIIKNYVSRYPYWRYFEDADMILAKSMKPVVTLSPFSSFALLESINEPFEDSPLGLSKRVQVKGERDYIVPLNEKGM